MAEPAFLEVRCPSCGAFSDRVPARLAGRTVRCPRCAVRFAVPDSRPAPGPAPAFPDAPPPTVPEEESVPPTIAEAPTVAPSGALRVRWQPGDVVLDLYEVRGVLGQGGMGRVYRVWHRGWGLDLAVKAPLDAVLEAAGGADLFEREAETWVSLGLHPHVVTCHYVRRIGGLPLVFAEYVDGGSLHEAIRSGRLSTPEAILDVAIQAAWGLHHAHEQGLVHRDVKPANVLLGSDGTAKVTDFGLARARPQRLAAPAGAGTGHTMTVEGGGGGTPAYLSPEQAAGETLSRRSDIWSFALSLLEAFLGGRAWEYGLAAPEVLEAARRDGPAAGRPALPTAVSAVLARCFRARPEDRPHDLAEVATVLREAWEAIASRPYSRLEPKGGAGSADALNNRAVSLVDLGRAPEAEALWRQALEAEAQHLEATYNAGLAAWAAGRLADPELLRRMEEACASHAARSRSRPRAQQLLGRLHLAIGQAKDARTAFERGAALGGTEDLDRDVAAARRAPEPPPRSLRGLPGSVSALALAPDGPAIAGASGDEVRLWDTASGRLLRTLAVPEGPVRSLVFLPGARSLLVGAERSALAEWDLESGRPGRSWPRHTGFATSLAVAGGGRFVVSGGSDRLVRQWDVETGRCLREMAGHEDAVTAVAAGAATAASASRDGTVRLWSLEDGRCLATLRGHVGRVLTVAISESQARVVSAGEDGSVRDWGLRSHQAVRVYASHGQAVPAIALSPDGARILSGSTDRTVRAFDTDGERLCWLARLEGAVQALAVAPDGAVWAAHGTAVSALAVVDIHLPPPALCRPSSASQEEDRARSFHVRLEEARRSLTEGALADALSHAREARSVPGHERAEAVLAVWDDLSAHLPRTSLQSAWEDARLEGHADQVLSVAVDASGARALSAGLDSTLRLWDLGPRRTEAVLAGHDGAATSAAFAGARHAVSGGRDRTVRLWDLAGGGRLLAVLEGHTETVAGVGTTPDGRRAASASWDGTVRIWDLRDRNEIRVLEGHGAHVAAVRFAPDGQVLASAGWDGRARLWDAATGSALGTLAGHEGNVTAVAIHADGREIATGGEDGTVRLWDLRTLRAGRVLGGHEGEITGLVFTPDGRFLLSSSRDRTARVWDLRLGATVRVLPHPALALGLALTPIGSAALTACADGSVRIWHLDWELETVGPPRPGGAAGRPGARRVAVRREPASVPPSTTLREDLRRAAPVAVSLPRVALPARLPWRRVALLAALLAAIAVAWLAVRRPAAGVRLSPYMAAAVPRELDLIDRGPFLSGCSPGDYARHLERLHAGNADARDVACLSAHGAAGLVADVLDGAPLAAEDPLGARRLRRSAASALAGLEGDAVAALCARLGDERVEAREVAAMALGVLPDPAASSCLRDRLASGTPHAQPAAKAMRQRLARGLSPVDEAWALTRRLLEAPDPEARLAGLLLAPMFAAELAAPAVLPLLGDADPAVAGSAREALDAIERILKTDQLRGDAPS
jgi:WD40 repeat protein/serine/threonine protein kinase